MTKSFFINRPAHYLVDTGLLFSINQKILHPLGFSLVLCTTEDVDNPLEGQFLLKQTDAQFHFPPAEFVQARALLNEFMKTIGEVKIMQRQEELGYTVQPLPDAHYNSKGIELWTYAVENGYSIQDSRNASTFRIPSRWAEKQIQALYDMSLTQFFDWYEFDHSYQLYLLAEQEGVLLESQLHYTYHL